MSTGHCIRIRSPPPAPAGPDSAVPESPTELAEPASAVPESPLGGATPPGTYAWQSYAPAANVSPSVQMLPALGSQYGESGAQSSLVAHA